MRSAYSGDTRGSRGSPAFAEINFRQRNDHRPLVDRIGIGTADISLAGRGQIRPRRHQHASRRQRQAAFAQAEHGRKHEISAGGISGKGDVFRPQSLIEHPAIGRQGILKRRRKAIFRRQPVVDREHPATAGFGNSRDQFAMRRHRAEPEAAAVKIENGLVVRRAAACDPFAIHSADGDTLVRDRRNVRLKGGIPIDAHLRHRRVPIPTAIDTPDALDHEIERCGRNVLARARHASRPFPCRRRRRWSHR